MAGSATGVQGNNPAVGAWSSGLCDCFDDCGGCCLTFFCPCVAFGRIAGIVDQGATSCCASGTLYFLLSAVTGFGCLYSCCYRSRLRTQYGLAETPCADCCVHLCCEACALCQEYRELKARGFDMSIGGGTTADQMEISAITSGGQTAMCGGISLTATESATQPRWSVVSDMTATTTDPTGEVINQHSNDEDDRRARRELDERDRYDRRCASPRLATRGANVITGPGPMTSPAKSSSSRALKLSRRGSTPSNGPIHSSQLWSTSSTGARHDGATLTPPDLGQGSPPLS